MKKRVFEDASDTNKNNKKRKMRKTQRTKSSSKDEDMEVDEMFEAMKNDEASYSYIENNFDLEDVKYPLLLNTLL